MIRLRNVEKVYEQGVNKTYVLRRVDMDVREGEFGAIMGPSGAGKSTLLNILGMFDSAWTGEYSFWDREVHKLNKKERGELHKRYIGFVFQSYHLLDHMTVYEKIDMPLSYKDVKQSERQSIARDALARFQTLG